MMTSKSSTCLHTVFPALPLMLFPDPPMPQVLGYSTILHFLDIQAQSQHQGFVCAIPSNWNIFLLHSLPLKLLLIFQELTQMPPVPGSLPWFPCGKTNCSLFCVSTTLSTGPLFMDLWLPPPMPRAFPQRMEEMPRWGALFEWPSWRMSIASGF